ncbi:MAG: hypothetical protein ACRD0G_00870 [Acidimicrobiales bacterium]
MDDSDPDLDQVFMGVHGMSESAGFTTSNLLEADTNRAFVQAGGELVILAEAEHGRLARRRRWGVRVVPGPQADRTNGDRRVGEARAEATTKRWNLRVLHERLIVECVCLSADCERDDVQLWINSRASNAPGRRTRGLQHHRRSPIRQ